MLNFWIAIGLFLSTVSCERSEDVIRLREELLVKRSRNPLSRPVQFQNETVDVQAYLRVNHIQELDEKRGVLTINGWMIMHWVDLSLKWDGEKFGKVYFLHMPPDKMWLPDLHLLNNAEASNNKLFGRTEVEVFYDGSVFWFPSITASSICDLDFTWFPMDEHKCSLDFASWLYVGTEVNLTYRVYDEMADSLKTIFFEDHNQWELLESKGRRSSWFEVESYYWPVLVFELTLKRHAPYYHVAFVIPCAVALLLTLAVFWLPPTDPVKFTLAAFTNTFLILYLAHLYWVIPRNSNSVPCIVILYGNMSFFAGMSLVLTVLTNTLSRTSSTQSVPDLLRNFIHKWLGTALCLQIEQSVNTSDNRNLEANEQKPSTKKASSNDWFTLATVVDRLCFLIYCLSYFIIFMVAFL